jgi:mRNA-degrading endonuclease RelE of RelBE toxin-antitoxin system
VAALEDIERDPFSGDIARLKPPHSGWRRRVGHYRLFLDIHSEQHVVDIVDIARRTSTTY